MIALQIAGWEARQDPTSGIGSVSPVNSFHVEIWFHSGLSLLQ